MSMILGYIKEREISFLFFLLLVLLVIVLWNLYKKEKKREEAAELSVAGERKYYLLNFVTLCCGILTIETSHSFLRSFCFIGQNGAFSTMEQNSTNFLGLLLVNPSGNPIVCSSIKASPLPAATQNFYS